MLLQWRPDKRQRYDPQTELNFRGSHSIVITCDVTDQRSVDSISKWIGEILRFGDEKVKIIVAATKCDKESERVVSPRALRVLNLSLSLDSLS